MVSGEHRRQKSSPLVGAQTGWRRTALTCCVVGIMCVSVLLMHAARRTELSVAGHGSLRSRGKKGVRGRGGAVDAGLSAAAALKEKARREDSQSRRLRMQANKDYDAAHEMMRKAGVLAQSVARTSKKEGALRALVVQDKQQIAADKRSLTRVGLLKKEIAKMRMRVGKELKRKKLAETTVALARKRLVRDEGRLGDQRTNVGKLLRDASQFADEAETSLKKSQVLRLNSLSSKNTRDTSAASTDFEDAGHEQRKSKTMTRKALAPCLVLLPFRLCVPATPIECAQARTLTRLHLLLPCTQALDYRSRARLGQEYVLTLSKMV